MLERIQRYFGVGVISRQQGKDIISYRVNVHKDLIGVIIPHFDKYPLITKKRADYELFKQVVDLMGRKEHLTSDGLQKIVNIRASLNNGLSDALKAAFPNTKPVQIPVVEFKGIPDPNWLSGFVDGEGCFFIAIKKPSGGRSQKNLKRPFKIQNISTFTRRGNN